MITIRRNIFETNSSSTHSLSVVSKEEWEKFKAGELYFASDNWDLISKEDIIKLESFKDMYPEFKDQPDEVKKYLIEKFIRDNLDSDYAPIYSYRNLDPPFKAVYDKDGNEMVAFSFYFYG